MQLRKQWNPDGYLLYAGDDSLNGGGGGGRALLNGLFVNVRSGLYKHNKVEAVTEGTA